MRQIVVMLLFCGLAGAACAEDINPAVFSGSNGAWPLYRQWNMAETRHYAEWITNIYRMKCRGSREQWLAKLDRVLTDPEMNLLLHDDFLGTPSNPQLDMDTIEAMHNVIDCGKLTVALGAYYAYRRGLPWMQCYVRTGDGSGDLRTAAYTVPCGCMSTLDYDTPHDFFVDAIKGMCTGNFRVELKGPRSELSDTVPVAINRESLIPGCLFYLDGHILILADIDKYGEVYFLDATVSPTRDLYIHNGFNAVTGIVPKRNGGKEYAGCYRGFRVSRYPVAVVNDKGVVTGVRRRTDEEMKEFGISTEQYDSLAEITDNHGIREKANGHAVPIDTFHNFVRFRLRTAETVEPVAELERYAQAEIEALKKREELVQAAWKDRRENGPVEFPETRTYTNIFNAGGRWGQFATAIDDLSFRLRYFTLQNWLSTAVSWFQVMPEEVSLDKLNLHAIWTGNDLAAAISREKNRIFGETTFEYTNSTGNKVTLSLLDVERRLFDLSFDPNQPPELRWGAPLDSEEIKTAPETPTVLPKGLEVPMLDAYRRQSFYRHLSERDVEPTALRGMLTEGFPVRDKLEQHIGLSWRHIVSPRLVPHDGLLNWLKENPQGIPGRTPMLEDAKE